MLTVSNTVFNLDCVKGMKKYADKQFDWAICDIPYGIDVANMAYLKEKKTTTLQKNGKRLNANNRKNYTPKNWDKEVPTQEYYDELCRVSKNQIIFGIEYTNWQNVGTGRIVWDKCVPEGLSFKKTETMYCSSISNTITIKLLWTGFNQAKSLAEPTVQQGNKKLNEIRIHPTHKPILLYKLLLKTFCAPNSKILDTHVGGGSIRIACYDMNMHFEGYEIDEEYYAKQQARFLAHKKKVESQFRLML